MRGTLTRVCLIGILGSLLLTSAPEPKRVLAVDPETELQEAIRFREAAGFRSDPEFVNSTLSNRPTFSSTEFGVPLSEDEAHEMRRRIDLQNALEPAWSYEESQPDSGGSYIDQAEGGIPVFLFTAGLAEHRAEINRRLPAGTAFRAELVKHTTADLTAARDQIWAARAELAALGVQVQLAGLDPSTNSVLVGVEKLSPEATAVLQGRFGSLITVRDEPRSEHDLHACTSRVHCWPPKGGVEINTVWQGLTRSCTSGFMVKRTNLTPNRLYVLTAGHCIELTGGVSVNRIWTHVGAQIGYSAGETWATNAIADAGVIYATANPTVDNQFLARESPIEVRGLGSVAALVETKVGTYVCRMGRTTGRRCGFVYLWDVTRNVEGRNIQHQWEVDFDADDGDSGAPMFEGTKGYGIHTDSTAGDNNGHGWFSPLYYERQALMGVNINIEYCLTATCP